MKRFALFALLTLFALPLAAQDIMPAYILIRLVERGDPAEPMNYLPGYAVAAFDRNQYGGLQVLPKFGQIIVTDQTVGEINTLYCVEWQKEIDWEFVSHDMPNDTHVLNVFTRRDLVSQSGLNGLTREKVEAFLNSWGAVVQSINANSVVFSANIATVIASDAFWAPLNVSQATFTELGYVQATGVHTVRLFYGNVPGANQNNVAAAIVERGCTVTANNPAQSRMTFTCSRDNVFTAFKRDVKEKTDGSFARRKWRVTSDTITSIINAGGTITVTRDQLLDLWHSRLLD